jgi:hypothetical protein
VWLGLVAKPDALLCLPTRGERSKAHFFLVAPSVGLIALVGGALGASFDLSGTVHVQSR